MNALGQKIRKQRYQKELTQAELAEKAGVSTSFIGHIERGSRILSLETFLRLCKALDTDPNTLLSFEPAQGFWPEKLDEQEKKQLRSLLQYSLELIRNS